MPLDSGKQYSCAQIKEHTKKGKLDISFSCKHDFISGVNRRIV